MTPAPLLCVGTALPNPSSDWLVTSIVTSVGRTSCTTFRFSSPGSGSSIRSDESRSARAAFPSVAAPHSRVNASRIPKPQVRLETTSSPIHTARGGNLMMALSPRAIPGGPLEPSLEHAALPFAHDLETQRIAPLEVLHFGNELLGAVDRLAVQREDDVV